MLERIDAKTIAAFDEITKHFGLDWFTVQPVRDFENIDDSQEIKWSEFSDDHRIFNRWNKAINKETDNAES